MQIYNPHISGHGVDIFGGFATLSSKKLTVFAVTTAELKNGEVYDVSGLASSSGPAVNFPHATFDRALSQPAIAVFIVP